MLLGRSRRALGVVGVALLLVPALVVRSYLVEPPGVVAEVVP